MAETRTYFPGEDRSAEGRAKVVCQAGGERGRFRICGGATEKVRPVIVLGHDAIEYQCQRYTAHRFAVWEGKNGRRVRDTPPGHEPPAFGDLT